MPGLRLRRRCTSRFQPVAVGDGPAELALRRSGPTRPSGTNRRCSTQCPALAVAEHAFGSPCRSCRTSGNFEGTGCEAGGTIMVGCQRDLGRRQHRVQLHGRRATAFVTTGDKSAAPCGDRIPIPGGEQIKRAVCAVGAYKPAAEHEVEAVALAVAAGHQHRERRAEADEQVRHQVVEERREDRRTWSTCSCRGCVLLTLSDEARRRPEAEVIVDVEIEAGAAAEVEHRRPGVGRRVADSRTSRPARRCW